MADQVSVVRAAQDFFSNGRHGRRIEITEFKELTRQDKEEIREMLIDEGYDISPLPTESPSN